MRRCHTCRVGDSRPGHEADGRTAMFERLLVPIDASSESLLALPFACRLAEAAGARLCLLRVALAHEIAHVGSFPAEPTFQRMADGSIGVGGSHPAEEVILRA